MSGAYPAFERSFARFTCFEQLIFSRASTLVRHQAALYEKSGELSPSL